MADHTENEMLKLDIAARLRVLVSEHQSANSFATRCGIPQSLLRKYLSGTSLPGLDKLIAISEKSGVRVEWLAFGRGPMRDSALGSESAATKTTAQAGFEKRPPIETSDPDDAREEILFLRQKVSALTEENVALRAERATLRSSTGHESTVIDSGSWLDAWPILLLLVRHYPKGIGVDAIEAELDRERIIRTRVQIERVLALLQREGIATRNHGGEYLLSSSLVKVRTKDRVNIAQHGAVAVRLLVDGIMPAVEKGDGTGYLGTAEMTVAGSRRDLPRELSDAVRKICEDAADDGGPTIRIVLGVGFAEEDGV